MVKLGDKFKRFKCRDDEVPAVNLRLNPALKSYVFACFYPGYEKLLDKSHKTRWDKVVTISIDSTSGMDKWIELSGLPGFLFPIEACEFEGDVVNLPSFCNACGGFKGHKLMCPTTRSMKASF